VHYEGGVKPAEDFHPLLVGFVATPSGDTGVVERLEPDDLDQARSDDDRATPKPLNIARSRSA
jgi:hypothetical protein